MYRRNFGWLFFVRVILFGSNPSTICGNGTRACNCLIILWFRTYRDGNERCNPERLQSYLDLG